MGPEGEERWLRTLKSEVPLEVLSPGSMQLSLWRHGEVALGLTHVQATDLCGASSPVDAQRSGANALVVTLGPEGGCRWARSLSLTPAHDTHNLRAAQGRAGEVYLGGTLDGAWPFPSQEGVGECGGPGRWCTQRWDGFLMRIGRQQD
jgi:hypothetical protein